MSDQLELREIPKDQYLVAEGRTEPIRQHYLRVIGGQSVVTKDLKRPMTLVDLCAACYLQGVTDAAVATADTAEGNDA